MWKVPPRSVLVAVDFGEASARALRVAHALATTYGAKVTALHAETLEVPPYFTHDQLRDVERHRAAARREAERYLAAAAEASAPGAVATLVDGPPVPALLAAAAHHDLVVVGTHGRRGPSRWWMGSVAERVVRDSPAPVLVVRAEAAPTDPATLFATPVVVAGPEFHGEAHRYAEGLAAGFGGRVVEKPVESISDLACEPGASVMAVAIGRHHGSSWFGDTAERLVRVCELPMLFVPNRA